MLTDTPAHDIRHPRVANSPRRCARRAAGHVRGNHAHNPPQTNETARRSPRMRRAVPDGRAVRVAQPICWYIVNMGMYSATTMPPMMTPSRVIMIGSIMLVSCSDADFTSAS